MKIYFSPYELHSLHQLNAVAANRVRKGALLKIEFSNTVTGFADLHPWPELGDPDLEQSLSLKSGPFRRSVALAQLDGEARAEGKFLQPGILKSHRILRDLDFNPQSSGDNTIFKIKLDGSRLDQTPKLEAFFKKLHGVQRVRIDFNLTLTAAGFDKWLSENSPWLLRRLDFIEDPSAYDTKIFERWHSVIAYDRLEIPDDVVAAVKIVKPVREDIESAEYFKTRRPQRIVFTHNMDHPLGQRAARVCASQFYAKYPTFAEAGGLDVFDGYHLQDQSIAQPQDAETGLGFDDYLYKLPWKIL